VADMSVATQITSSAMPASSQSFAVINATFAELHAAETFIDGPWKPNSWTTEMGVEGSSRM
jgi:hypothetical protein